MKIYLIIAALICPTLLLADDTCTISLQTVILQATRHVDPETSTGFDPLNILKTKGVAERDIAFEIYVFRSPAFRNGKFKKDAISKLAILVKYKNVTSGSLLVNLDTPQSTQILFRPKIFNPELRSKGLASWLYIGLAKLLYDIDGSRPFSELQITSPAKKIWDRFHSNGWADLLAKPPGERWAMNIDFLKSDGGMLALYRLSERAIFFDPSPKTETSLENEIEIASLEFGP